MADHVASKQDQEVLGWSPLSLRFTSAWETGGGGKIFRSQDHRPPLRTHTRGDNKAAPRKPAERM